MASQLVWVGEQSKTNLPDLCREYKRYPQTVLRDLHCPGCKRYWKAEAKLPIRGSNGTKTLEGDVKKLSYRKDTSAVSYDSAPRGTVNLWNRQ